VVEARVAAERSRSSGFLTQAAIGKH
jgi:hypothetical protein